MKIAILGARKFPPGMSGIDRQIFELSKRLFRNHEVYLFLAEGRCSEKNIHIKQVPHIRKELGDISLSYLTYNMLSIPYIIRTARKEGIDIIHANNPISGFVASIVRAFTGIPFVYTARGTIPDNMKSRGMLVSLPLLIQEKIALKKASAVTGITPYILKTTINYHNFAREIPKEYVPNGIDMKRFQGNGALRKEYDIKKNEKIVIFIGRLVGVKGLEYLIRAFKGVAEKVDSRLVIVGDGPLKNNLEGLAKELKIDDKIIFTGSKTDIEKLLPDADVLALSSLHEGFPNVALEAMASGVPVVATRIMSIPDIIKDGECGLLVPERDSEALEKALIKILKDDKLRGRMKTEIKKEAKKYDFETITKRFLEIYKKVLR